MLPSRSYLLKMTFLAARSLIFLFAFLSAYSSLSSWKALKQIPTTTYKLQPLSTVPTFDDFGRQFAIDSYTGDLKHIYTGVYSADISFVFYYAPWDRECQEYIGVFFRLARKYADLAYFAAINCWYSKGECKQAFPKTHHFPQLIAYVRGIQVNNYNGRFILAHLEKFIYSHLKPVKRLSTMHELINYTKLYQGVVVGYYDVLRFQDSLYNQFIAAARKSHLISDESNILFMCLTSQTIADYLNLNPNDILLLTWNTASYFNHNGTYSSDSILKWLKRDFNGTIKLFQNDSSDNEFISRILSGSVGVFIIGPKSHSEVISVDRVSDTLNENCNVSENVTGTCLKYLSLKTSFDIISEVKSETDLEVEKMINLYRSKILKTEPLQLWHGMNELYHSSNLSEIRINNSSLYFILTDPDFDLLQKCHFHLNTENFHILIIDKKNEVMFLEKNVKIYEIPMHLSGSRNLSKALCQTNNFIETKDMAEPSTLSIQDISSADFEDLVVQNKEDVLVFYYSVTCGLCVGVSHVILSVANMIRFASKIKIYRIDTTLNALPWQYTVYSYPTLVLFPGYDKADSVVFPYEEPITLPNVITFLANNISPENRLKLLLMQCNSASSPCLKDAKDKMKLKIKHLKSFLKENTTSENPQFQDKSVLVRELSYLNFINFGLWTKLGLDSFV
ncbi:thioredoxin domain-containing protein 11-like [Artemia franciscana]|uniref:Thioredoxin domain-containing protein n=1 Tax=Artemia franciscana TaxID=6661 RepID=A0AA88HD16_ARTSF|nr:hypothetical protein QYM36_015711 [Artemia franciscana]KAK2708106.1 hypothetical protein QYM36_015711 [Artemia franciscana]KAK2708107.1 hypothetical protein QYM36_015711 [Artemia franciscana]KAK2708108.1 hypothetical protein QYM36_015711 [Artemia franciscana]KAK2708109.1 hypothetical protein QYM36_015711 [Artemia franciscana]